MTAQDQAAGRVIGLIVNPVAGMGGSVGLKGTDGGMHRRAIELGARPVAAARALQCLTQVSAARALRWLVAPGVMGEDAARHAGLDCAVVGALSGESTPDDTRRIAREMLAAGAALLVVVGGDGTARDICDAIGVAAPVVAVPAGVKVYSAVFAVNPRAAAAMIDAWVQGADVGEEDVLDIDEEAFRAGRLDARLHGALQVPQLPALIQGGKEASGGLSEREEKQELAAYLAETMVPGRLYLLAPGTTVKALADALGVAKTLLGVDAVVDSALVGRDLNEAGIRALLNEHPSASIVVAPLGGNGFIFGRGNKQLTPAVIRLVGVGNVIVMATRAKLDGLKCLRVDSGDPDLDRAFAGYLAVLVGRGYSKMMRLER